MPKFDLDRLLLRAYAKYGNRFNDLVKDPRGQIAAFGLMGAIVGAAVGLGVVAIVLVLMPSVAGNVITAMYPDNNFSANLFNGTIASVPSQTGSSFSLLGVAALVVVVMIIVGTLMGAFLGSRQ
jgi:hypothetical protein